MDYQTLINLPFPDTNHNITRIINLILKNQLLPSDVMQELKRLLKIQKLKCPLKLYNKSIYNKIRRGRFYYFENPLKLQKGDPFDCKRPSRNDVMKEIHYNKMIKRQRPTLKSEFENKFGLINMFNPKNKDYSKGKWFKLYKKYLKLSLTILPPSLFFNSLCQTVKFSLYNQYSKLDIKNLLRKIVTQVNDFTNPKDFIQNSCSTTPLSSPHIHNNDCHHEEINDSLTLPGTFESKQINNLPVNKMEDNLNKKQDLKQSDVLDNNPKPIKCCISCFTRYNIQTDTKGISYCLDCLNDSNNLVLYHPILKKYINFNRDVILSVLIPEFNRIIEEHKITHVNPSLIDSKKNEINNQFSDAKCIDGKCYLLFLPLQYREEFYNIMVRFACNTFPCGRQVVKHIIPLLIKYKLYKSCTVKLYREKDNDGDTILHVVPNNGNTDTNHLLLNIFNTDEKYNKPTQNETFLKRYGDDYFGHLICSFCREQNTHHITQYPLLKCQQCKQAQYNKSNICPKCNHTKQSQHITFCSN